MPSIYDFATWVTLARLLTVGNPEKLLVHGGFVVGAVVGRGSVYTCRVGDGSQAHHKVQWDAERLVSAALEEAGLSRVALSMRVSPSLDAVLDLFDYGPAVEPVMSPYPESMVLIEGAVAQPWRQLPEPVFCVRIRSGLLEADDTRIRGRLVRQLHDSRVHQGLLGGSLDARLLGCYLGRRRPRPVRVLRGHLAREAR